MKQIVAGALFNDGKLLICKRTSLRKFWSDLWELPGGKVETRENDFEALVREFFEETQLKIRVMKKYYTFYYDYVGEQAEENDYIVESNSFDVKIDPEEHTEFRWVSKNELGNFPMSSDMKKSVEKAFEIARIFGS